MKKNLSANWLTIKGFERLQKWISIINYKKQINKMKNKNKDQ